MLHKNTIEVATLGLLKELMKDEFLNDFVLVGGTALALQIGHRNSIDLDLFTKEPINEPELFTYLKYKYSFEKDFGKNNTLKGQIEGVKIDMITHNYPNIQNNVLVEGVRMASLPDIAAMKFNAIMNTGTRIKDFIDIAFLSSWLPMGEMLSGYGNKYPNVNPNMVYKSLSYFKDIDFSEPINLMVGKLKWPVIEKRLLAMINNPSKIFPPLTL
jgi:hypothetical protein